MSIWEKLHRWINSWFSGEREGFEPIQTNYVKLTAEGSNWATYCHGSLVSDNLVLTASHCVPDDWTRVKTYYGRAFENEQVTERNDEKLNWVKLDTHRDLARIDTRQIPPPDLALIKLPRAVTPEEGTFIAAIPAQDSCANSVGRLQAYQSINMPRDKMDIKHTVSSGPHEVQGTGLALRLEGKASRGDSGSPVMSSKGELVGLRTGRDQSHGYAPALCKYSDELHAHARHLTNDERAPSQQVPVFV